MGVKRTMHAAAVAEGAICGSLVFCQSSKVDFSGDFWFGMVKKIGKLLDFGYPISFLQNKSSVFRLGKAFGYVQDSQLKHHDVWLLISKAHISPWPGREVTYEVSFQAL